MNSAGIAKSRRYRDSWLVRTGVTLLVIGSGPLLLVIAAADLGLTRDPNPNPVGFGILAGHHDRALDPAVLLRPVLIGPAVEGPAEGPAEILVALVHALRRQQMQHGGVDAVPVEQLGAEEIQI